MAKTNTFKTKEFSFDASMKEYFDAGKKTFTEKTMIHIEGIKWEVRGNQLFVIVEREQEEQWFFYLAFCIGLEYGVRKLKS